MTPLASFLIGLAVGIVVAGAAIFVMAAVVAGGASEALDAIDDDMRGR